MLLSGRLVVALDTRYRPRRYSDVLGQEDSVSVLKRYIIEGRGFHQSYVFCGQHGSGKTTLGRILARALLCEAPVDGEPCDQCESCQTFLRGDPHECFVEMDAATKSGKADLAKIIEDTTYSTVSGKQKIYLLDESHRLSKSALDILLKPMEDNVPGSENKRLVCIFCTTEPEKMVNTIFSRCAPAFVIRSAPLERIADRLEYICDQEGIPHERDALMLVAEQSGSHIRDAIKMVESVSLLGGLTQENTSKHLHLDSNHLVLDLVEALGQDLPAAVQTAESLARTMSPSGAYGRLAEAALLIYRVHLGVGSVPLKWDQDRVKALADRGEKILNVAQRFAAPPHRPTSHTLMLDTASAHHLFNVVSQSAAQTVLVAGKTEPTKDDPEGTIRHVSSAPISTAPASAPSAAPSAPMSVFVDPRGIGHGPADRGTSQKSNGSTGLDAQTFKAVFQASLRGGVKRGGSKR
jgi:DNA polymerase III subunit gamma/tau